MQIPRFVLDNWTDAVNEISKRAAESVRRLLEGVDWSDVTAARESIEEAFEQICATSAESAAELSALVYDVMREASIGEASDAKAYSMHDAEGTSKALRAIVQSAVDGKPENVVEQLVQRAMYEVSRAAGDTIMENGVRDKARVRFARVPSGAETCSFCMMLASRGFVYANKRAAGSDGHYHAHCDCRIVPSFDGSTRVEGYDPDAYYRRWKEATEPSDQN